MVGGIRGLCRIDRWPRVSEGGQCLAFGVLVCGMGGTGDDLLKML